MALNFHLGRQSSKRRTKVLRIILARKSLARQVRGERERERERKKKDLTRFFHKIKSAEA